MLHTCRPSYLGAEGGGGAWKFQDSFSYTEDYFRNKDRRTGRREGRKEKGELG